MTENMVPAASIEQEVHIAASPETVWSMWTTAEGLSAWWGSSAEVVCEPGGLMRVVMEGGPVMCGAFVTVERPTRLVFTFGWEDPPDAGPLPPGSTRVEVTFTPDGAHTILNLRHFNLPGTQIPAHQQGWTYFLGERLPAVAPKSSAS
ncbi:MAG: SRPBCC domain-containing protein [Anaerolineaceae bacterium]